MTRLTDAAVAHLRRVADWPELPGERFEVQEAIGQGGMGTVYRARDRVLDRDVALKVLRPEIAGHDWAVRLEREARVLARLEHPGVVPVHDVGTLVDGRVYYLMKLVRGERLDVLARSASLAARLRLFLRVLDTVAFAHANGVVHRDLKPSNIMVGSFGEVMVLDWGIAKLGEGEVMPPGTPAPARPTDGDTAPGTILGTPGFMAPEQASGAVHLVGPRTDIFALGAILHALITDDSPGPPPRPLSAIASRASSPDLDARFASVSELSAEVTRFLDGEQVQSYREPLHERLGRWYVRYQTPILLVLAYLTMRLLFLVSRGL